MTPLSPLDLELLYFLCAAHHHRCRVTRIKGQRQASLKRLRYAGLVSFDGFIPSPSAIADWLERRNETPVPSDSKAPAESPEPEAIAEGGRRCSDAGAPPPKRKAPPSMAERARRFDEQRNTQGTSGAHGGGHERSPESGLSNGPTQQRKPRTPDTAASIPSPEDSSPSVDPPAVVPMAGRGAALEDPNEARPRSERSKVDIKVNTRRDPTQRPPGYQSRPGAIDLTDAVIRTAQAKSSPKRKQILREASARNAAGKSSGEKSVGVHVRMAQRSLAEQDAEDARLACPIEQAMTKLRRRYTPVYGAEVSGGPAGKFYVGRKLVTEAELLAMAARVGA